MPKGTSPSEAELKKLKQFEANQEEIRREAKQLAQEATAHFRRHQVFTPGRHLFPDRHRRHLGPDATQVVLACLHRLWPDWRSGFWVAGLLA